MASLDSKGVIVACPECGTSNRMSFAALGKTIRCGRCKASLSPPAAPIEVRDPATFDAAAATSALPLIVDFWAPWCGPCRMVAPELERLAQNQAGKYLVVKVNTDEQTEIAARYRIQSIPTLAVVYQGREVGRVAGARSARDIQAFADGAMQGRRAS